MDKKEKRKGKNSKDHKNRKVFINHSRFLLILYGVTLVITLLLSLVLPKVYQATTTVFRPSESQTSLEWLKAASTAKGFVSPLSTNVELFLSILKSRSMEDEIIRKFDLLKVYHLRDMQEAREEMKDYVKIGISREKVISIAVCDRDPTRAAAIANFYVKNLDKTIQTLNISSAKRNRLFIEERLEQTIKTLSSAEEELKNFQIKEKVAVSKDLSRLSEIAGELEGRLVSARVELEILKKYTTVSHPEVLKLKHKISEIQKALVQLPASEEKLSKLLRKVKTQETIYTFLTDQLEQAKIAETRDTPIVQVLDYAIAPDKPYRPDIELNLGRASLVVLLLGSILFFVDALQYLGT